MLLYMLICSEDTGVAEYLFVVASACIHSDLDLRHQTEQYDCWFLQVAKWRKFVNKSKLWKATSQ